MKKLNNKGFVASAVLYSLLILFLALLLGLFSMLSNRKMILDKLKGDIKKEINQVYLYEAYENGTVVYFNPVTNKLCSDYIESKSATGIKNGCMKWYIFNDNSSKSKVNMILDHNTTAKINWNSIGSNNNMSNVTTEINKLVNETNWKVNPRLITVDEIAEIAKAKTALNWTSNKLFGTNVETQVSWFYFDGSKNGVNNYNTTNGWQKQYANNVNKSDYSWLFDRTSNDCESNGCNNNATGDNITDMKGYWTSTKVSGDAIAAWSINKHGNIYSNYVTDNYFGIRPVIELEKTKLDEKTYFVYNYTGNEQSFVTPTSGIYKMELWGAQGGGTAGGKGSYSQGLINLDTGANMHIYVGGAGTGGYTNAPYSGGYNGGGSITGIYPNWSYQQSVAYKCYSYTGGGATDIRLIGGTWNNFNSLKSRIMVAAGGGGMSNQTGFPDAIGGAGGTLTGLPGMESYYQTASHGTGGTQTSGGASIFDNITYKGKFGFAANVNNAVVAATGGGGYYAGGGTYQETNSLGMSSGGGGSSFISGHTGCKAINESSTESNITHSNQPNHYSGLIFTNTSMIAGNESMPTHDGNSTMTGNSGNGYAKITYCGADSTNC